MKIAIVVIALIAVAGGALAYWSSTGTAEVSMTGVAVDSLHRNGVTFLKPGPDDHAAIAADKAVATEQGIRDGTAREVELGRLTTSVVSNRLAWAVNFDPDTVTSENFGSFNSAGDHPVTGHTLMAVAFVDAQTGQEIFFVSDAE